MKLYLIRHGKTLANELHLYCGSTDLPLSPSGTEELKKIHYDISDVDFISSGMKRANQTLELLFANVPYEINSNFREVDFGIFEMQSYDELKSNPDYKAWLCGDNEANIPPHGESGEQMKERVLIGLSSIKNDSLIVTHGGVIAIVMAHLFPHEKKNRYQWQPPCGHGYLICDNSYSEI